MRNRKLETTALPALLLLALAMLIPAPQARAEIPQTLSVQGVLTDVDGKPVPDGQHYVVVSLYNAATGGLQLSEEDHDVETVNGLFSIVVDTDQVSTMRFADELWVQFGSMTPRIRLTAVPYARRAAVADSVAGGSAGADDDWTVLSGDVYRLTGRVYIGTTPDTKGQTGERDEKAAPKDPVSNKLTVHGENEGAYALLTETNTATDGRAGLFAKRNRTVANPGTGFGVNTSNTAVTGYNLWGDSYTFGVAGYTWFDDAHTAGVLGCDYSTTIWGALAYQDDDLADWGLYTPVSAHVGGTAEVAGLRMTTGAAAGHVLTGDSAGNATWQPPGAAVSDDDWVIQGTSVTRNTNGVVAVGTDTPTTYANLWPQATLQVSSEFHPAVVLDKLYGTNTRWSMWLDDDPAKFNIGRTLSPGSTGHPTVSLHERQLHVVDDDGDETVVIQSDGIMEEGPVIHLYGESTSPNPTLTLDGQFGTGGGGGMVAVFDGTGHIEVMIEGNHNGTGEGRVTTPVLEITGGSDLSEQFDVEAIGQEIAAGMVVSIDPARPGRLTLSGGEYDRRVAGVISGAGGVRPGMLMGQRGSEADGELPVALVGRVYVWADASQGPIEPGDLLTTAETPGHAMRADDPARAMGAILGKAMTSLQEGKGLVLTLVALQ